MGSRDVEFTEFVAARRTQLRRIAYALCGDWHQADDLVQIALAKLYVAWPRIHKRGAEEAYARQIIVRTSIDESRRPWRREYAGLDGLEHEQPTSDPLPTEHGTLIPALQQLPEMQRKCVVLRHWLDLSVEETARELTISAGTVKSHTSRALVRLHELMTTSRAEESRP